MKVIIQSEASECGLACLAMVASHFDGASTLSALRRRFSVSLKGMTLGQLMRHAAAMCLTARPLRLEIAEIPQLRIPAILHWDMNHFVVLKNVRTKGGKLISVTILDPAVGERDLSMAELSRHFTGVALELWPGPDFKAAPPPEPRLKLRSLVGKVVGLPKALGIAFLMALLLQLLSLLAPQFNQIVVDEVITAGDSDLLTVMVIGFAVLLVIQISMSLGRSWLLVRWGTDVEIQWSSRVMAHLLRLPLEFFEKRHVGDIVTRFGSLAAIQGTLTSLFVESAMDGIMAIVALAMMYWYSAKLAFIVIVGVALYVILRLVFYGPFKSASQERLILAGKESTFFLETVRAMAPVKLFGREADRVARWVNIKQEIINRDLNTKKLSTIFQGATSAIGGAQNLAIFFIAGRSILANEFTVGMLFAFSSYASTFSTRIFNLVDLSFSLRMLSMHNERLADIVLAEPEQQSGVGEFLSDEMIPKIEIQGVKFRYADGEPWVLENVNMVVQPGEHVAFIGPSGGGKSTLMKLILGILHPTEGQILINGHPLTRTDLPAYRRCVGTIMQDDTLLSGSIIDNVSFFDEAPAAQHVEQCCRFAELHNEITRMPMAYQTLVGDLGSSLSGGQRQRLLLARAMYKRPKVLALDEATSHLDPENERIIMDRLTKTGTTIINISHRPDISARATRVFEIAAGSVTELAVDRFIPEQNHA